MACVTYSVHVQHCFDIYGIKYYPMKLQQLQHGGQSVCCVCTIVLFSE